MPFNTAIVKGNTAVTGGNFKLGRWDRDLSMRNGSIRLNTQHRQALSNDMGALAGLLFDVGSGRFAAPPRAHDAQATRAWETDLQKVREGSAVAHKRWLAERASDATRIEIQGWLRDLRRRD